MYCSNCGKEQTKVETGTYNIRTGEKMYEDVCIPCNERSGNAIMIAVVILSILFCLFGALSTIE